MGEKEYKLGEKLFFRWWEISPKENHMFCKNCGAKLPDGAKFCTLCGTAVDEVNEELPNEHLNTRKKPANPKTIAIVSTCFFALVIAIVVKVKVTDFMDDAQVKAGSIAMRINLAQTDEEKDAAYNAAKEWLEETEHSLIDGTTSAQRKIIIDYVENYTANDAETITPSAP